MACTTETSSCSFKAGSEARALTVALVADDRHVGHKLAVVVHAVTTIADHSLPGQQRVGSLDLCIIEQSGTNHSTHIHTQTNKQMNKHTHIEKGRQTYTGVHT